MHIAYHHIVKRNRQKSFGSSSKTPNFTLETIMDSLVYISALFGAFMNIPQLTTIWIDKHVSGVSVITWIGFLLGSSFWLCYGIVHKEKPIILTNGLYVIIQFFIVLGLFIYGGTVSFL